MYRYVFKNILFPTYEKLKGRNTASYLHEYENQQWWGVEKLKELQFDKLKKLVAYSYTNVPYYKKVWNEIGFSPNDLQSLNDFESLPVLTKEIIRENYNDLISEPHKNDHLKKTTGGSTGSPLSFAYTSESYSRRNAVMWRGYSWADLSLGVKALYFWGTNVGDIGVFPSIKDTLYNKFYNRSILSCFDLNESRMMDYVDEITKQRPDVIVSYVNPIYNLSKWILEHKINGFSPKSIITGAEPLHEFQRKTIEDAFECEVFNTYGCREVMLISSECGHKSGLHMNIDHLVIESVDDTNKQLTNQLGELLLTDLHNYGMPFIRYKNEDLVIMSDKVCSCGRGLPLMHSVEGRVLDCIKTPDNRILPGEYFPHYFKDFTGIDKFQVVQKELTKININIVVNDSFTRQNFENISKELLRALGGDVSIDLRKVQSIPLTKSGKHRVTISEL